MNIQCITKLTLSLLILCATGANASLQQATQRALENNPEVQANWYEYIGSGHDIDSARAGYKPSIDVIAGYGYRSRNFGPNRSFDGAYSELSLTQRLYDGGETRHTVRQFENLELVSLYRLLETSESITLEVVTAYHDVARYQQLLDLAQQNLKKHNVVYQQIQESAEAGVARNVDLEQINGRLSLARANVLTEASNLHDVAARYLRLVGEMPPETLGLTLFNNELIPLDIKSALTQAYQTSPTFRAAIKDIRANEEALKTEKSKFKPRLNLTARHSIQEYDDLGFDDEQEETRIDLELSYNIYSGGRDSATKRRAYSNINRSVELRNKACVDVRQTLQIAHNDVFKLKDQLPILNQHRISSDRVRTAYKQQFDIGQRTLLDLLDSENEFFQASRAWNNARYDQSIAVARSLAAMGKLMQALEIQFTDLPSISEIDNTNYQENQGNWCPLSSSVSYSAALVDADQDNIPDYSDDCLDSPLGTETTATGCSRLSDSILSVELDIKFEHNSSYVKPEYFGVIEELASSIRHLKPDRIEIAGHTSLVGGDALNLRLSQRRANAVKEVLVSEFGIAPGRVVARGYGENRPLSREETEEAHTMNRRIEAHFQSRVKIGDKQ